MKPLLALLQLCAASVTAGTAYNVFGESISCPVGDPAADARRYPGMVAAAKGWTLNNRALSGSLAIDQSYAVYETVVGLADNSSIMIGTNDERNYQTDLDKLALYRGAVMAEAVWLAIPAVNRFTAKDRVVSYTGQWSDNRFYKMGKRSMQNGATVSFTVSGTVLYIGTTVFDNLSAGKMNVSVDGSNYGTFDSHNIAPIAEGYGMTFGPSLIRVWGLVPGLHKVTLTVQDSIPDQDYGGVYFDWAAGISPGFPGANVYLGTIPNLSAQGYVLWGGSPENIARFNRTVRGIAADLQADGLNVRVVESNAGLDSDHNLYDGLHPNDVGHAQLRDAFLNAINSLP